MKSALKALRDGTESKTFKFENDYLYLFDKTITMTPFLKHFEIPKFDKFRGKGNLVTHVKYFYMPFQEVAYNDIFLMHIFPKSLGGPALEWFYCIPQGIVNTFVDLSEAFMAQYAHLVKMELSVVDLVNTKKRRGKPRRLLIVMENSHNSDRMHHT